MPVIEPGMSVWKAMPFPCAIALSPLPCSLHSFVGPNFLQSLCGTEVPFYPLDSKTPQHRCPGLLSFQQTQPQQIKKPFSTSPHLNRRTPKAPMHIHGETDTESVRRECKFTINCCYFTSVTMLCFKHRTAITSFRYVAEATRPEQPVPGTSRAHNRTVR